MVDIRNFPAFEKIKFYNMLYYLYENFTINFKSGFLVQSSKKLYTIYYNINIHVWGKIRTILEFP